MASFEKEAHNNIPAPQNPTEPEIDPNAPAGSPHSLGAESVRDGRPATSDKTIEAIDEEGPGVPPSPGA